MQHRELMAQHRDLDVAGIPRRTQPDHTQKPALKSKNRAPQARMSAELALPALAPDRR
jgi:hypothetical protein